MWIHRSLVMAMSDDGIRTVTLYSHIHSSAPWDCVYLSRISFHCFPLFQRSQKDVIPTSKPTPNVKAPIKMVETNTLLRFTKVL